MGDTGRIDSRGAGGASSPDGRAKPAALPGAWLASIIALLTAGITLYLTVPGNTATRPATPGDSSRMNEVEPGDLDAALDSVSGTPQQLDRLRKGDACGPHIAWVAVVRAPNQAPGRIRLKSGSYISPAIDVLETPVRVAIPYPAPYAMGRGVIAVVGASTGAVVTLSPPWHLPAQAGEEGRLVTWTPDHTCPTPGK